MKTSPDYRASRNSTGRSTAGKVLGAVLAIALPLAAIAEIPHAVWRLQEIPFVYRGYTTRYDCDALRTRVKQVLGAVAVNEATIRPIGCSMIGSSGQIASMEISVVSPAPLTAETQAEVQARSSRQELLERLGVHQELGNEFVAQWREIDVARDLKFDSADCEFLRQIGDQVLSHLAVRLVMTEGACSSSPPRFKQARLKVQALTPVTIDGLRSQVR